ncbi:ArnT family glycosyltransferase [Roseiconus lacunae]|uniref:ArnT family glycosyltransferase n=1 Tax=Roseiconus lacunae TaxID=2605694 RepID=UPI001E4FEE94|nr:glycosyltransferase family 39 protein [Roseiconus lacunae]MCD0460817.1 glycosyltransferase family 39 protein [Roseiconus lacunae]
MIRKCNAWLIVAITLFLVLRIPLITHQSGIQDEHWFAVPGYTLWEEGVPRIPYVPSRIRDSFFENADVCLMTLPPGLALAQAPFFAVFQAGYPTARLPSLLAALATIVVTYSLVRRFGGDRSIAGFASLVVALSRPLLFAGITSRPDALCILFGLLCADRIVKVAHQARAESEDQMSETRSKPLPDNQLRSVSVAGVFCGFAALCHPLGIVFAMQSALVILIIWGGFRKVLRRWCVFAIGSVLGISPWLPYIVMFPYEFRAQFVTNVLDRAGPGLFSRLTWPIPSLIHHSRILYELLGSLQLTLFGIALVLGTLLVFRSRRNSVPVRWLLPLNAWAAVYLTATAAGLHPIQLYWAYAFVWSIVLGAIALGELSEVIRRRLSPASFKLTQFAFCIGVLVLLLPGGGLRSWHVYVTHWNDPRYNASRFIANVLSEIPEDALCYSDLSYVFDIYLSGRPTRLCAERELFWGDDAIEYDYLLLSWEGRDADWAQQYDAVKFRSFGSDATPQHCYVDVFRHEQ